MTIIVIGAGFAGRAAIGKIKNLPGRKILLEQNSFTTMFPSLPDVASGSICPEMVYAGLVPLIPAGVEVVKTRVTGVDCHAGVVKTSDGEYGFDFLVLACGSKVDFHGFNQHLEHVHTLDSFESALKINRDWNAYLETNADPCLVVAGGGYTGIECACALREMAFRQGRQPRIVIVQREKKILPFLSVRQRRYVFRYLTNIGVEVLCDATVTGFDSRNVECSNQQRFENVFFCWCAGSTLSVSDIDGDFEQIPDGRVVVDAFLRAGNHKNVFAAGDCAAIEHKGQMLRKAVNFSVYSGAVAGDNVCRLVRGEIMRRFQPVDLGWVIPLGMFSVGRIFGIVPVYGRVGLFLHYCMCGIRNYSLKKAFAYIRQAVVQVAKRRY